MKDQNATASVETFIDEEHEPVCESQESDLLGAQVIVPIHAQLRKCLRTKIEKHLFQGFAVPELVEGLAEYLLEVVQEDPAKGKLFGVRS